MNEEDLREIIIQTLGVNPGVLFNIWETWQNRHTAYRYNTIALVQVGFKWFDSNLWIGNWCVLLTIQIKIRVDPFYTKQWEAA